MGLWGLFKLHHGLCLLEMKAGKSSERRATRALYLTLLNIILLLEGFLSCFTYGCSFFCIFPLSLSLFSLTFSSFPPIPSFFSFSLLPQYTRLNEAVPQRRINSNWWLLCCCSGYCIDPHLDPPLTAGSWGMLCHAVQCVLSSVFEEICKYFSKSIGDWSQINHFDLMQNLSEYSITKYCHC